MRPRETTKAELPYQMPMESKVTERPWRQIVCKGLLFSLVPGGIVGCVCEEEERMEEEHYSLRRSLRGPGRNCIPISPHPYAI